MTINITKEIEAAYKAFLAEQVDAYVDGAPILRSQTYPFSLGHSSVVEFAAGWQAALSAGQATEPPLTDKQKDEMPILHRSLLNTIGEYGLARTDGVGEIERIHRWQLLIDEIKVYAREWAAICASRAAGQVIPEPPTPSGYAYRYWDGIRFNDGREVNGSKPTETLPYWFAPPASPPVEVGVTVEATLWPLIQNYASARVDCDRSNGSISQGVLHKATAELRAALSTPSPLPAPVEPTLPRFPREAMSQPGLFGGDTPYFTGGQMIEYALQVLALNLKRPA